MMVKIGGLEKNLISAKTSIKKYLSTGALVAGALTAQAGSVNLTWDVPPNPNSDIAMWELFYKPVNNAQYLRSTYTTNYVTLNGLQTNVFYTFFAKAVNRAGIESPRSQEITYLCGGVNIGTQVQPKYVLSAPTDLTPPSVKIVNTPTLNDYLSITNSFPAGSPQNPIITTNGSQNVNISITDSNYVTGLQVNGDMIGGKVSVKPNILGGLTSFKFTPLNNGANYFNVIATDGPGNIGTNTFVEYNLFGTGIDKKTQLGLNESGKMTVSFNAPSMLPYHVYKSHDLNLPLKQWTEIQPENIQYDFDQTSNSRSGKYVDDEVSDRGFYFVTDTIEDMILKKN